MNWKRINVLLEKLNTLHSHLEKYEEVSDAEKDLMMSYLKSMYEELGEGREVEEIGEEEEYEEEIVEEIEEEEIEEEVIEIPTKEIDPAMLELFENQEAKELSEKLQMLPIKDIYKSMSINERAFTVTELFGGDNTLFRATIEQLNAMSSYDDAKVFLTEGIAEEQGWTEASKVKKAVNFIQLVQRRYK